MFRNRPSSTSSSSTSAAATAIHGSIRPPPDFTRQQHLDSYLQDETLSKSTRRVSTDDSTYDTVFQTVDHWTLIVRVHLPPASSAASTYVRLPTMTLAGIKARHAWLDTKMNVVGYASISSESAWKEARLLLGTAVLQVIQHLQLHPPEILEIVDKSLRSIQRRTMVGSSSSSSSNNNNSSNNATHSANLNHVRSSQTRPGSAAVTDSSSLAAPAYESVFDEHKSPQHNLSSSAATTTTKSVVVPSVPARFNTLSPARVQELLDDEEAFLSYCNALEYTRTLVALVETSMEETQQQATRQMARQQELQDLHRATCEREQQLLTQVDVFRTLEAHQDVICQPPPLADIQRMLNRGKRAAFDASEQMAEEWNGERPTAFFEEFLAMRKIHHVRAAKLELMASPTFQATSYYR